MNVREFLIIHIHLFTCCRAVGLSDQLSDVIGI